MKKRAKKKNDHSHLIGATFPVVIAIDPATTSGYAVWVDGEIVKYGIITDYQEDNPFTPYQKGLLIIESQYLGFNPATLMLLTEIKAIFKVRAKDQGFEVAEQNTKTWQSAIGVPIKSKRATVKRYAKQYAESIVNASIPGKMQDAADAICIGQTFIDKHRIEVRKI